MDKQELRKRKIMELVLYKIIEEDKLIEEINESYRDECGEELLLFREELVNMMQEVQDFK